MVEFRDSRLPDRFWSKVSIDGRGCWRWTAWITESGYGRFWLKNKKPFAHRLVYESLVSPIPEDLVIDHLCRVRCCVNPDHLEPVTVTVNNQRAVRAIPTGQKEFCVHGHRYTPENTNVYKAWNGKFYKRCRTCRRIARKNATGH